jgi:hypothetical protein
MLDGEMTELLIWHLWESRLSRMGMRPEPTFIDVFVEPNDNAPEGSGQRFKAEDEARPVSRVRWEGRWCRVSGWSSDGDGSPCAAQAITVEDSGSGTAVLIFGGDWGVRLQPEDGSPAFGEAYLLVDASAAS